jgi:RHS repeat-associated protein
MRSNLVSYANNLVTYIKANNPTFTTSDVIGGKKIVPLAGSPIRQTSLPYLSTSQPAGFPQIWGSSVPNAYRTCFTISMPGVAPTQCGSVSSQTIQFFSDQVYGQRITIFSVPVPGSSNLVPTLLINGVVPSNGVNTGTRGAPGTTWNVSVCVKHPYANLDADVCHTNPVTDAMVVKLSAGGSYLVSNGWGQVSRGMIEKHRQLLSQALSVSGVDPSSEPVLGESLAVIGYNWLAEVALQQQTLDAIGQTVIQYHHGVGIIAQSAIQQTGHQGPYVDLPSNILNVDPQTCFPNICISVPITGPFFSSSGMSSAFEAAVLEQTQAPTPNMIAASTVKLVDMNAATGAKTFFADGTTSSGQSNYVNMIRPALQQPGSAYSASDLATIDTAVTGSSPPPASPTPTNNQVLAPANGNMTVGVWKGAGYTIIRIIRTQGFLTSIGINQFISGNTLGGASGTDISASDQPLNTNETIQTPPASPDVPTINNDTPAANPTTINEPIDAVTGAEIYNNTDIVTGNGVSPYALPFSRTHISSSNLTDVGLGNGWTHTYSLSASANSDPYQGMGASSPIRAAAAIAGIYVSHDLLGASTQSAQFLTLTWIVDRWITDQLTNNAVLLSRPDTVEEFIALPRTDGQTTTGYSAPLGSSAVLTGTSTGAGPPSSFTYTNKDQTVLAFAPVSGSGSSAPISTLTTPNGMRVGFAYDGSGRLATVSNNLGRTLTLSYTGNHVSAVSDGARSVTFNYSGNALTSATDPLLNKTTYSYDAGGRLAQVFYPSNPGIPFFTNNYDALGRVAQQLNANGQVTAFYFAGSRTEMVDAAGNRHVTYQTPRSKIVKGAAVLSSGFGNVYNDTPQQNGVVNVTTTQYDGLDRPVSVVAPEGGTTGYTYSQDFNNNVISVKRTPKPGSPLSPLTRIYSYDPIFNKPVSITDSRGLVTTMSYDGFGNLTGSVSDFGSSPHFNATTAFTYNNVGQVLTATDPLGTVTQYSYDGAGNLLSATRDAGTGHFNQRTSFTCNAQGDVISVTDPRTNVTSNTYDAARRLASITAPNGLVTVNSYDPNGQLVQTQQFLNGTLLRGTGTTYSLTGKPVTTTDADGNKTTFSYDALDRVASVADQMGRVTSYGYDALSRQISISNPAIQSTPLLQKTYTPDGVLATLTDANNHATSFAYDGLDRLSTTTYSLGSTETLTYDADNNVLTRKTRAGPTITFTYDTLNRLATKTPPSPAPVVTYNYDLASRVTGISDTSAAIEPAVPPGGTPVQYAATYIYDAMNRPTGVSWSPAPAAAAPTASSVKFGHTYNQANQRIGQTISDNSWVNYPAATPGTASYISDALNRYTAVGAVSPSYDGNGNLTSDGTFTLGYDAENRLTSAVGAGNTVSYAYDAQGRRKSRTVNGVTTVFVTDAGNREVLEYDGTSGAIQRWYSYALGPNDVLNQMNVTAGTRATLVPDILGSIIGSQDSSSGALTKIGYLPYGKSPSTGPFGFTGQRVDVETNGLYYYRARHYSPAWGRFLQPDPIGYRGGPNLYAYTDNDPVNQIDPSGNCPACIGAITSVAIGLGVATLSGQSYTWQNAATDAALGALGVGLVNKFNQVVQLAKFADALPVSQILMASGNTERITQGVYYLSENGAAYIGQGGLRATGETYATRIAESSVQRFGTDEAGSNAIRFGVNNGALTSSREVAEQNLIDAVGGIGDSNLLNARNPIGAARQNLLTTPGLGEITDVAVPNLVERRGAAAFGTAVGASESSAAK